MRILYKNALTIQNADKVQIREIIFQLQVQDMIIFFYLYRAYLDRWTTLGGLCKMLIMNAKHT